MFVLFVTTALIEADFDVKCVCGRLYIVQALGLVWWFFFQAEDGIRDLVRSRGLGDVYKRQARRCQWFRRPDQAGHLRRLARPAVGRGCRAGQPACLLYTSDAADERSSVDLGGRRIIKKNKSTYYGVRSRVHLSRSTHSTTCITS